MFDIPFTYHDSHESWPMHDACTNGPYIRLCQNFNVQLAGSGILIGYHLEIRFFSHSNLNFMNQKFMYIIAKFMSFSRNE